MNQGLAIVLLLIIVIIFYFIIKSNQKINQMDFFTLLRSIEKPLTTYDDYGTFNFIHHINDLPYYDSTYDDMIYLTKTTCKPKLTDASDPNSLIPTDSFVNVRGNLVRRKLIPFNYTAYGGTTNNERMAPQGFNYFLE